MLLNEELQPIAPTGTPERHTKVTHAAASQEDFRSGSEYALVADVFCGPLSALILHETLQGQKINNSNQIHRRVPKTLDIQNSSKTTNSYLSEIKAKALHTIQTITVQIQAGKSENEERTSDTNLPFALVLP